MPHERASTHLDHVRVCLTNHWLEREWSSMLGHTTSLRQRADSFEWLHADSLEFRVVCNGEALGALDLGAPDWSEEQSPAGAKVVCTYTGHAVSLTLWTMALHEQPTLYRGGEVANNGVVPIHLDYVCLDILPLLQSVCDATELSPSDSPWDSPAGAITVARPGRCMVAACEAPLRADTAEDEDAAPCCFRVDVNRELAPGERLRLPELLLLFSPATSQAVMGHAYPASIKIVRDHRAWLKERFT